jgi:superfamily II DNA or RNA helicase
MVIDETRYERQKEVCRKWEAVGFNGTFIAATGFGKSFVGVIAAKGMVKRGLVSSIIVTVPLKELKDQWEATFEKNKIKNFQVLVNNTAAKHSHKLEADFVIHDEAHTVPGTIMRQCLDIKRKYTLCLTATIERRDGEEEIILDKYPVFDEIPIEICLENGWVSPYKVYNIAVPLPEEELKAYKKADNLFKHCAAKLGYGAIQAAKAIMANPDSTDQERANAAMYYNAIRKRKVACINNTAKFDVIIKLSDFFNDRYGLIFGESIDFADKVTELLGDKCMTYHSKLNKKEKVAVMKRYRDLRTKTKFLSSVKALDAGFDFPDISLGIIAAGNSSLIKSKQRLGRIIRAVPGKEAVIINLYSPNTQEKKWLDKRLEGIPSTWVNSIDEFLEKFDKEI